MGIAAADYVAGKLQAAISEKGAANLILATGASQFSFFEALQTKEIDWKKITVFHLDEYKGTIRIPSQLVLESISKSAF